eukprot:9397305-Pyramimonas_sp.AAC.1
MFADKDFFKGIGKTLKSVISMGSRTPEDEESRKQSEADKPKDKERRKNSKMRGGSEGVRTRRTP